MQSYGKSIGNRNVAKHLRDGRFRYTQKLHPLFAPLSVDDLLIDGLF